MVQQLRAVGLGNLGQLGLEGDFAAPPLQFPVALVQTQRGAVAVRVLARRQGVVRPYAEARAEILARRISVWSLDTAGLARAHAPRADLEVRMRGVALAGVFLRVSPFAARAGLHRDALLAAVGDRLGRFYGKRGQRVVEANLGVISAAYDNVQNVTAAIAEGRVPVPQATPLLEAIT